MIQIVRRLKKLKRVLGIHTIIEFYGCSSTAISDSRKVEQAFLEAARLSKAHIVDSNFHYFTPHGVSGVVIIAESHFSVHTWPEFKYAAIDFFSCSSSIDIDIATDYLKKVFLPKDVKISVIKRGLV